MIWGWPEECAQEILDYLDKKYGNTKPGRIKNAAKRKDHIPPRPELHNMEKEALSHFGLKPDSPEVREMLQRFFGVTSHKDIDQRQHWQFVWYLKDEVDKLYGDS